jgi:hypothetical protein
MTTLNLTGEMEKLIGDIVLRVPELSHIEPSRVLVCVASTRGGGVHGTYAKIHPLRFPGGGRTIETRRGLGKVVYAMPEVNYRGIDMLYIVYFLVPRFLNLPLREKLITIFHELYHISPQFDGDIRRFPGKNYAHGSSRKRYNSLMARLVEVYLGKLEDESLVGFLEGDMAAIRARHRVMVGRRFPAPRLTRISG